MRVHTSRNKAMFDRQHGDDGFGDSGRAKQMPGPAFGRTARHAVAEYLGNRRAFAGIVRFGRRAVQIDVVDVVSL